jgi:hypothetical protein
MTTLLLTCRVEDYKTWRPLYEGAISCFLDADDSGWR